MNKTHVQTQFPILAILGLIFITLKLTGFIAWSWWWVLAPFWLLPAIVFGGIAVAFLFFILIGALKAPFGRK